MRRCFLVVLALAGCGRLGFDTATSDAAADASGTDVMCAEPLSSLEYVKAPMPTAGSSFGVSVALSADGSTLAVGASTANSTAGAVHVLVDACGYTPQAELVASNGVDGDALGSAVALSADGNTLVVAAVGQSLSGAVYVFARTGDSWTEEAMLKAGNADSGDNFGAGIAISADGTTIAVGAPSEASATGVPTNNGGTSVGAAYVFVRSGTTWAQQAYLKATGGASLDTFGFAVALADDGDVLAIGAPGQDSSGTNSGALYTFRRTGTTWAQQSFHDPSPGGGDLIGTVLSMSSDAAQVAIGSPENAFNDRVFTYANPGPTATPGAPIAGMFTEANDAFGEAIAMSADGTRLAIGSPYEDSPATGVDGDALATGAPESGAVHTLTLVGGVWTHERFIKALNTGPGDFFGWSVALSASGAILAVGAPNEDTGGVDAGAVYVYR